jgi:hypothetical protein
MNDPQGPSKPVSLEDILRLKRAERPTPEFWAGFDAQLRRKQLSAIVERRPWWRVSVFSTRWAKVGFPVGAAAAVAVAVLALRTGPVATVPGASENVVASSISPSVLPADVVASVSPRSVEVISTGAVSSESVALTAGQPLLTSAESGSASLVAPEPVALAASGAVSSEPQEAVAAPASATSSVALLGLAPVTSLSEEMMGGREVAAVSFRSAENGETRVADHGGLHLQRTINEEPLARLQTPQDVRRL